VVRHPNAVSLGEKSVGVVEESGSRNFPIQRSISIKIAGHEVELI
jgi:hypothetical protein